MIEAGGAHIDADLGAGEAGGRDPRIFQRLPHHLQQQALLRSICAASRGDMPNTVGSKSNGASRKPPAKE